MKYLFLPLVLLLALATPADAQVIGTQQTYTDSTAQDGSVVTNTLNVTGGSDIGYGRQVVSQTATGNTNIRSQEFHCIRAVGTGWCWALELGVHSTVPGDGGSRLSGVYAGCSHNGWVGPPGPYYRCDSAYIAAGEDGWTHGLLWEDANNNVIFDANTSGVIVGTDHIQGSSAQTNIRLRRIAVNSTLTDQLAWTGGNSPLAIVQLFNNNGDSPAQVFLGGGNQVVTIMSDPNARYSTTAGTTGKTNVYWSAANGRYEIQNLTGSNQQYSMFFESFN